MNTLEVMQKIMWTNMDVMVLEPEIRKRERFCNFVQL